MHVMKTVILWLLRVLLLCSFISVAFWIFVYCNNVIPQPSPKKTLEESQLTKDRRNTLLIDKARDNYVDRWEKQEINFKKFRSLLSSKCQAVSKAVITQNNTPPGSSIIYDGEKRKPLQVAQALFNIFPKDHPFGNASWESCAVVGNGGILTNSSCGKEIDSANFVIRCNLPPLGHKYKRDVGNKTHMVTANPSILHEKYNGLMERRLPFVRSLSPYGQSLLLLPAFSYGHNTPVSLRAFYTLEDFGHPAQLPVFLNPEYLRRLAKFWQEQGLKSVRISTGLIMASLALEICANVHLFGFWPFDKHPHNSQQIMNHYYDDRKTKKNVHSMPSEFEHLLKLHNQGVLRVHLGQCDSAHS